MSFQEDAMRFFFSDLGVFLGLLRFCFVAFLGFSNGCRLIFFKFFHSKDFSFVFFFTGENLEQYFSRCFFDVFLLFFAFFFFVIQRSRLIILQHCTQPSSMKFVKCLLLLFLVYDIGCWRCWCFFYFRFSCCRCCFWGLPLCFISTQLCFWKHDTHTYAPYRDVTGSERERESAKASNTHRAY